VQQENSPRLTQVKAESSPIENISTKYYIPLMANGEWSHFITTATTGSESDYIYSLSFKVSSGEVRPRNQAIRIWKRVQ
jgi:hypothetical protein